MDFNAYIPVPSILTTQTVWRRSAIDLFIYVHEHDMKTVHVYQKVQVGNGQEMAQLERNSHSKNRGVGKTELTLKHMYLYQENIS